VFRSSVERVDPRVISPDRIRRTTSAGALLLAVALAATACGGSDDPKPAADPTASSSVVTPTPTPTPSPTQAPLSPFEDRAPVKAARSFMVKVARAINAGDRSMRSVSGLTTPAGTTATAAAVAAEIDRPATMPGPYPFTPVAVRAHGGRADVVTCMLTHGWSRDKKTHKVWEKRTVEATVLSFKRIGGRWKFDHTASGTADCSGVELTEVHW
jgi:hypothetical protein